MLENGQMALLNMRDILPNRFQPRIHFEEKKINELADSIRKYGLIQPIIVRQIGSKYEIIAGERRFKASSIANKETIPAIIVNLSDRDSEEIALLENIQREDLTPIEEAVSYKRILDIGYITQDGLAKKIGKSQSFIANKVRLLNLDDEVQDALLHGKISERHARSLLKIHNNKDQVQMLNRIINERLTVKMTDREIKKLLELYKHEEEIKPSGPLIPTSNSEVETLVVEKKPKRAVPVGSHRIIKVSPPEDLMEKIKERERQASFMDIDKILEEAKDISSSETPKPANDIAELMKQTPNTPASSLIQSSPTNDAIEPEPLVDSEQNKFVNFGAINQNNISEQSKSSETQNIPSQPLSPVSFDSIFNQVPVQGTPSMSAPQTAPAQPTDEFNGFTSSQPSMPNLMAPEPSMQNSIGQNTPFNNAGSQSQMPQNVASGGSSVLFGLNNQEQTGGFVPNVNNINDGNNDSNNTPFDLSSTSSSANDSIGNSLDNFSPLPNMNIPDSEIIESTNSNNDLNNVTPIPSASNKFKEVVDLVRNCASEIEKLGYSIDVDEVDMENNYQVTFKINKE